MFLHFPYPRGCVQTIQQFLLKPAVFLLQFKSITKRSLSKTSIILRADFVLKMGPATKPL